MGRTAVIDSSPLISLVHLGLAKNLSLYFDLIYVPREVEREVNKKSRFRYRLRNLYRVSVLQKCKDADETLVRLNLLNELDRGEAEALAQALDRGAMTFICDERRGRRVAERMGRLPVGTARILARLHQDNFAEKPKKLIRKLQKDLDYHITDDLIEEAISKALEPI